MPRSSRLFPSDRYGKNDPLRRLFGLRLLTEPLPTPLATLLLHAWMFPARYNGNQAIQSRERLRLPEDVLPFLPARRLDWMTFIELGVSRRLVEIPRTEITREERNYLLREQGVYLAHIYQALVAQLGEATAQAVFAQRVQAV